MSFGGYGSFERDRRRNQRRVWAFWGRFLLVCAVIAVIGGFTYQFGAEQWRQRYLAKEAELIAVEQKIIIIKQENENLVRRIGEIRFEADQIKSRYDRDVPTGPLKDLADQIQVRLADGLDPNRLRFVISQVRSERTCGGISTKRFLMRTPLYQGANTSVSFADDTVTVTGEGQSAIDSQGRPEAWYDPAQSIALRFTVIGGDQTAAEGLLPLHHSVVIGSTEHRFTVLVGEQGFVTVVQEPCSFP